MKKDKAVIKAELKAALLKRLKSLIGPMIVLLVIAVGILVIMFYKEETEPEEIIRANAYEGEEAEFILENDRLKFVLDAATTQFTLTTKDTGMVWYSNPPDAANDEKALTSEKSNLQSTLLLTYSTINGVDTLFNNYAYSILNQIYEIEAKDDYIKVFYTIGDLEKEYVIPPVITKERMEAYLEIMSNADKLMVNNYYKEYDINNLSRRDEQIKDELLTNYPILETEVVYILRDNATDNIKNRMEQIFEENGYTYEEYLEDKELSLAGSSSNKPVFNISVIYRLEGDDLIVEIPMDEIEFRDDFPLYNLSVLPYFGAGTTKEEGYLLVPEGGGALIDFNNGKIAQSSYYTNLYGWDMATVRTAVVHDTRACFNVFGIAKEDNSYICVLEEGVSYASVRADISGRNNSYNYVNAVYRIANREQYDVGDRYNGAMFVYEEQIPQESLIQRYHFIDSDSYVDMADAYHDYLASRYPEDFLPVSDEEAPVALEILGAADKVKQVFGIPVSRPLKLTRYSEAKQMLETLQDAGFHNVYVKLTGWMNGGIQQQLLTNVHLISELGSRKDLATLIKYAEENGIKLYLDGVTNYAYDSDIFDGFIVFRDAARLVSQEKAELFEYSKVTFGQLERQDSYYLLSHSMIDEMADNLIAYAAKNGAGVSFRDIGMEISSDFDEHSPYTRQQALYSQEQKLQAAKESTVGAMVNLGNNYAIPYVDMVTNMDLGGAEYTILDRSVPFYQLAIHGFVNYSGEPLNLTQNGEKELLKSVEYGAGLHFTFMNETAFILQNTSYSQYFGADFEAWSDRAVEIYTRYNNELGHIFHQRMTGHEFLSDMVTCTSYEDGTRVYVNYSYEAYNAPDGTIVPARDYAAVKP